MALLAEQATTGSTNFTTSWKQPPSGNSRYSHVKDETSVFNHHHSSPTSSSPAAALDNNNTLTYASMQSSCSSSNTTQQKSLKSESCSPGNPTSIKDYDHGQRKDLFLVLLKSQILARSYKSHMTINGLVSCKGIRGCSEMTSLF